jgi:hypothetical protein
MITVSGRKDATDVPSEKTMTVGSNKVVESSEHFLREIEGHLATIEDLKLFDRLGKIALMPNTSIQFKDKEITYPRFSGYDAGNDPRVSSEAVTPEMRRMTATASQLSQFVDIFCVLVDKLEKW